MEPFNCPICGAKDWEDISSLRDWKYWYDRDFIYDEKIQFVVCKECGFATYFWDKNLDAEYDRQRNIPPMAQIIPAMNRKNMYHRHFLDKAVESGKIAFKPDMTFIDIGCALGHLPKLINEAYSVKIDNCKGTEFSEAYGRVGKTLNGIEVKRNIEDFGEDRKWDMISYYHVLEHIPRPDQEIDKILKHLAPGGYLYISVPVWFGELNEPGGAVTNDFENLFHINHCNVWSEQGFRNLLASKGLEIIMQDSSLYGFTVLCRYSEDMKAGPVYEDYKKTIENIQKHKTAIGLFVQKKYQEAVSIWPRFPDAFVHWIYESDNFKNVKTCDDILSQGIQANPGSLKILKQKAHHNIQWDQSYGQKDKVTNRIKEAEAILEECWTRQHSEEVLEMQATINMRYRKDYPKAIEQYVELIRINPLKWSECMSNILWMAGQEVK